MCFVRKALDKVFDQRELQWLDDIMPETHKRAKEDAEKKKEEEAGISISSSFIIIIVITVFITSPSLSSSSAGHRYYCFH
jgi:hypothetical protein